MADTTTLPETAGSQAMRALTETQLANLARQLFNVMEYDENGKPGAGWSGADTLDALVDQFTAVGVTFTNSDDDEEHESEVPHA